MNMLISKSRYGRKVRSVSDAEIGMMLSAGTARHLFAFMYTECTPAENTQVAAQEYETKVMTSARSKRRKTSEVLDGPSSKS